METFIAFVAIIFLLLPIIAWISLSNKLSNIEYRLIEMAKKQDKLATLLNEKRTSSSEEDAAKPQAVPSTAFVEPVEQPHEQATSIPMEQPVVQPAEPAPAPEEPTQAAPYMAETVYDFLHATPEAETTIVPSPEIQPSAPANSVTDNMQEPAAEEDPHRQATADSAPQPDQRRKGMNYEKYIGENLFGKIGILVFIIGIAYFVKYAIDRNWIGEVARTIMGFAVGFGMLGVAHRLRNAYRTFSSLLAGGAFGVFYLTTAIAFHYYHLFTQPVAFGILVLTTLLMSGIAIWSDRSELAITALVGGFIAPFIISTGESNAVILLTYMAILNIGMFALSFYKKWTLLPPIAFAFTYLILLVSDTSASDSMHNAAQLPAIIGLITLFYLMFLLPGVYILKSETTNMMNKTLLTVIVGNSFLYLIFGGEYSNRLFPDISAHGYVSLFIALVSFAIYAYLRAKAAAQTTLRSIFLALTIIFLSLVPPFLFTESVMTIVWAAESVVILWLFIKQKSRIYEVGNIVMTVLTLIAYFCYLTFYDEPTMADGVPLYFHSCFITSLFVALAMLALAILQHRYKKIFIDHARYLVYSPFNALMFGIAITLLIITFIQEIATFIDTPTCIAAKNLSTSFILLVSTWALRRRFAVPEYSKAYVLFAGALTALYMFAVWLNTGQYGSTYSLLIWTYTLITVVNLAYVAWRMLPTNWHKREQAVYFSLLATLLWVSMARLLLSTFGINGFSTGFSLSLGTAAFTLMLAGMRCHIKEVRMVSLAEFGIVIGKLVISDVWSMQAVGKIIVFISLGLILLTLSFLYQKLKAVLFEEEEQTE